MIISNYFLKRKVRELRAAATSRTCRFCTIRDARSFLVFYQAKDVAEVEPCLETLRMLKKVVSVCQIGKGLSQPDSADPNFHQIDLQKDLDAWGFPVAARQKELSAVQADILIDLTCTEDLLVQYLILTHPARFRVGTRRENEASVCDLSIRVTARDDVKYLFGQIVFYLQTIRSK
ncbi:MAG: DUF6913 domain-containing protein [Parabacteroides sp.]